MILELSVIQGQPAGKTLAFAPGEYFLGRGPECHVRFNSDWVSRQHCQIRVSAKGGTLRDLGSTNGTLLNGLLVLGEQALKTGDQIQIGPVLFHVCFTEKPAAALPQTASLTLPSSDGEGEVDPYLDSTDLFPPPAPKSDPTNPK